ncbi:MAG: hypothetical protein FJ029_13195 [Actinobacteria bacterium]|nr:hypothetical protein [Actinomycetota bacterium]
MNRLLEHPDDAIRNHFVELYGTTEILHLPTSAGDLITAARDLYQRQLRKHARFVGRFECEDLGGHAADVFFASNHPLGCEKMKDAMWKVDPSGR